MVQERLPSKSVKAEEKFDNFKEKLESFQYDEKEFKDSMYKELSKSLKGKFVGYKLLKSEILGFVEEGEIPINRKMFDNWVDKRGGSKFLERLFKVGIDKSKTIPGRAKRNIVKWKRYLTGKDRVSKNYQESKVGKDILELAKDMSLDEAIEHYFSRGLSVSTDMITKNALSSIEYLKNREEKLNELKNVVLEDLVEEEAISEEEYEKIWRKKVDDEIIYPLQGKKGIKKIHKVNNGQVTYYALAPEKQNTPIDEKADYTVVTPKPNFTHIYLDPKKSTLEIFEMEPQDENVKKILKGKVKVNLKKTASARNQILKLVS